MRWYPQQRAHAYALISKQVVQDSLVETAGAGPIGDTIAEVLEVGCVDVSHPLIFLSGHNHRHISILAPDYNWLALSGIEQGGKALLCFGS